MKVIAHRGNDNIHRENSIEAILNSLNKDYINGIEIDVRITKDNKLVLNHDPFYKGRLITNTKLKALQKLGLNSLNEVLNKINTNKIIMLDIKCDKINKYIKILNHTLNKYQLNFYTCSFNYKFLKRLKAIYNGKIGIICTSTININHIDEFDFNSIHYNYKGLYKKETFWWTINKKTEKQNIITDFPQQFITKF